MTSNNNPDIIELEVPDEAVNYTVPDEVPEGARTLTGPQGGTYYIPPDEDSDEESNNETFEIDEFSPDKSESSQSLAEATDSKPVGTARYMTVHEMSDGTTVYEVDVDSEQLEEARDKTMATYEFLNRIGANTAEYVADNDGEWFASEEVEGQAADQAPDEWKERVDEDQFTELAASNLIAGNIDMHASNVIVDEDGTVRSFDYDNSTEFLNEEPEEVAPGVYSERPIQSAREMMTITINALGLDIDPDDVIDRAAEMSDDILQNNPAVFGDVSMVDGRAAERIHDNAEALSQGEFQ